MFIRKDRSRLACTAKDFHDTFEQLVPWIELLSPLIHGIGRCE